MLRSHSIFETLGRRCYTLRCFPKIVVRPLCLLRVSKNVRNLVLFLNPMEEFRD